MQAATMTQELALGTSDVTAIGVTAIDVRMWVRRGVRLLFLAAGIAATAWIMGQYGTLLVYGLPAPFLRRIVVPAHEAAVRI
jgi:uncharacterized membrane protein YfcA